MNIKISPSLVICLAYLCINPTGAQTPDLEISAGTFSITPKVGTPSGASQTGHVIEKVYGDLKSTIFLFKDGEKKLCLFTSHITPYAYCAKELASILEIPEEAVIINNSHNHTVPSPNIGDVPMPDPSSREYLAWKLGREFREKLRKTAQAVKEQTVPVTVEWGVAEENRITYNRKGYRLDGRSYFVREEDRLEIEGKGYHGVIDPDAAVVLFKDMEGLPVAALTFFTGHPVAAYNPEDLISYGQFPQTASEILSDHLGDIPVGFVQGCAGNINAKHMLTGTIEQARELGEQLGESFIAATKRLKPSKRTGIQWSREIVKVPMDELPSEESLEKDLDTMDDFIQRGNNGDQNTLECIGMNFPVALSPPYRAKLVEMVRPWYVWALEQYETHNINNLPEALPVPMVVARFGDVGFVGMPYEPFVETGLKIKRESNLPYVLTCGYTDGVYGYIPNAEGAQDREYMSGNYRYRPGLFKEMMRKKDSLPTNIYSAYRYCSPYKAPAGDAFAIKATEMLNVFAK